MVAVQGGHSLCRRKANRVSYPSRSRSNFSLRSFMQNNMKSRGLNNKYESSVELLHTTNESKSKVDGPNWFTADPPASRAPESSVIQLLVVPDIHKTRSVISFQKHVRLIFLQQKSPQVCRRSGTTRLKWRHLAHLSRPSDFHSRSVESSRCHCAFNVKLKGVKEEYLRSFKSEPCR